MELFVREWGAGNDRSALLIHGIMSDSRTWWRVGPALAERGYHVRAVDLPGHGASPHAEVYPPELYADAVLASVPASPDLALGHSLGGVTLSLAVKRLHPGRAVYVDAPFRMSRLSDGRPRVAAYAELKHMTPERIAELHPGWPAEEIDVEVATLADWDPQTALDFAPPGDGDLTPEPIVPSLVTAAGDSAHIPPAFAEELRTRGFEVRVVDGAEHTIHRHTFDGFMTSLDGWA